MCNCLNSKQRSSILEAIRIIYKQMMISSPFVMGDVPGEMLDSSGRLLEFAYKEYLVEVTLIRIQ